MAITPPKPKKRTKGVSTRLVGPESVYRIFSSSATGTGTAVTMNGIYTTFQATAEGSHTAASSITIEVSNDLAQWITMGTISISGADDTDGFAANAAWSYVRARCTTHGGGNIVVTIGD